MTDAIQTASAEELSERTPEIRIFISSTFRDQQPEREYIIKYVFPELRMICRERGVEFTEIDLRWGVTIEEAEQGKVLKICLDEIDRCRPYFIGILGERYGWTPKLEDVRKDPELLEQHPWIIPCIENGISVTEMEMLYGVLENPAMADHAFFYFRDKKDTPTEFIETDQATAQKLTDLKNKIRASSFPVREDFPNPAELGRLIREDLLRVINERFPIDEIPSPLEQKRRVQEAYALTRRRAYVPSTEYLERLNALAESEDQPLVITGESGSGKSSLLAYWLKEYKNTHKNAFTVQFYVGAGSSDTGHLGIIQRIMEEIKERYQLEEDVPTLPEQLESDFPIWLAKVQQEKLILVLDSLDRLTGISANLGWLPKYFPPNIRVVISAAPSQILIDLDSFGFDIFQVHPLSEEECDKLILNYLGQYRKSLSKEQRLLITRNKKSTNPLFLRTVLEELRIFGSHEELDDRIVHYMNSADTSDLFQRMLARMEHDYGKDLLDSILSLIWASRRGLGETEILEISLINRLQLSHVLLALEFQLMRRTGLLDFYHAHLRSAVEQRYFASKVGQGNKSAYQKTHLQLAEYFKGQEISERKADELPWQYEQASEFNLLKDSIADLEMFLKFDEGEKHVELLGYWRKIGDLAIMEDAYHQKISSNESTLFINDRGELFDKLGGFFKECGRNVLTEQYFQEAVELRSAQYGANSDQAEESRFHLATLKWWIQGEYAFAESLFSKTLEYRIAKYGRRSHQVAQILLYLGTLEQLQARYSNAEASFLEAIEITEKERGPLHLDIAYAANKLACLYHEKGDYTLAEPLFTKAYEICERKLGKEHPTTIEQFNNLAELYHKKGNIRLAEQCYREAIQKLEKIYGREHPITINALNNLASTLLHNNELHEAEKLFKEVLEIEEKVFGHDNFHTAGTLNNLAETLDALGDYDQAEKFYIDSWHTLENILGKGHPITGHPIQGLGKLWVNKEDPAKAVEYFENAYMIRFSALGDHPETLQSLESYVETLRLIGRMDEESELDKKLKAMRILLGGSAGE